MTVRRAVWVAVKATAVAATTAVLVSSAVVAADSAEMSTPIAHQGGHPAIAKTYTPSATLAQLNAFLATVPGDGGESVLLPSGKVLWLFGDTLTGDKGGRNNYAIQTGARFERLGELKATTAQNWYWPGAATMDGGSLVIFWARMHATGSSVWDFAQDATLVDTYNPATLAQTSETVVPGAVSIASAVKVSGSWWLYSTREVTDGTHRKIASARRALSLTDPTSWAAPVDVLDVDWGPGTVVQVLATANGGVQVWTKRGDLLTRDIVTGTAKSPTGPFTAPRTVASPNLDPQFTYSVYPHGEQRNSTSSTIVLTYSTNGATSASDNHPFAITVAR